MKKHFAIVLTLLLLLPISGCTSKDKTSLSSNDKIKEITLPNEKNQIIDLNLFYDSSTDDKKASITVEERLVKKEDLLGELIMNELIKGPSRNSKLKPVLPPKTKLLSFSIRNNIAYADLSSEAKIEMSATKEEACLNSIVNSLLQLPSISKVQILIDHEAVETLGGNYNIINPMGKDDIDGRKNRCCCMEHLDLAFDDFILETETFPFLENTTDKKCSYCGNEANYILKKPKNKIEGDKLNELI